MHDRRRNSATMAIITAIVTIGVGVAAILLFDNPSLSSANISSNDSKYNRPLIIPIQNASVFFKVQDKPQQDTERISAPNNSSNKVSNATTTFLPISRTYTMYLTNQTNSYVYYPIDPALWVGWVPLPLQTSMVDKNNETVVYSGFTGDALGIVNANCTEPYPAKVNTGGADLIMGIDPTNAKPTSSQIPWGDYMSINFNNNYNLYSSNKLTAAATITTTAGTTIADDINDNNSTVSSITTRANPYRVTETGAGIVPINYTNTYPSFNFKGAGNTQIEGLYHITFDTFYNYTTVQLPKSSVAISFLKEACTINHKTRTDGNFSNNTVVDKLQPENVFSRVYVYDIWFRIPS